MEFKDLKREIEKNISTKPDTWRYGQFVFNYIDEKYGDARCVQFIDDIDCFYDDFSQWYVYFSCIKCVKCQLFHPTSFSTNRKIFPHAHAPDLP